MTAAIHAYIEGRVQGVWFRAATAEKAQELGVEGWARNLPDGRVEVLARGPQEALDAFEQWLHEGPPAARVAAVHSAAAEPADVPAGFSIR